MLYRRRIHFSFEKKIEPGSKWIEVWNKSWELMDPYKCICGRVLDATPLMVRLEISDPIYPDANKLSIVKSDFLARYKEV